MKKLSLQAELRKDDGTAPSRRLRKQGLVPSVVYGAGEKPTNISIKYQEIFYALNDESLISGINELVLDNKKIPVIIKEVQHHPFKPILMHVDFQRIDESVDLNVTVPLHFVNEQTAHALKAGGQLTKLAVNVSIRCLPKHLPEFLEIDIENMEIGDILHLSDIKLPEGISIVSLLHDDDQPVCHMDKIRIAVEEEADTEGESEGEGDTEGESEEKKEEEDKS